AEQTDDDASIIQAEPDELEPKSV
ncbi:MAG: hypothetical protein QOI30_1763, partial [Mycobacterium sp.]|nr:hypothetical protein [Mycobacterium sp.]